MKQIFFFSREHSDSEHMSARKRSRSAADASSPSVAQAVPADEPTSTTITPTAATTSSSSALTVFESKVVAPEATGIRCMAVNNAEDSLLVARESGSLTLYKIDMHQNTAHFLPLRRHAGRYHRTIQRMHFTENDTTVILAYLSGQIVVACGSTLLPMSVMQRVGGSIYDLAMAGPFVITAAADGTWRTLFYDASSHEVEHLQTAPKITGSDRALCVALSAPLSMAVGGDDSGNVVAWSFPHLRADKELPLRMADVERLPHQQLWCCRIAKGFPLTVGIVPDSVTPCVAVGSSIGDVMLLNLDSGAPFRRFSHHKGPVSTIAVANKMFFASGWHESLRSYRCQEEETSNSKKPTNATTEADDDLYIGNSAGASASVGEWYPSEVKRRTHYHEASQICVLNKKHQWLLSAAKDGTIMHSPIATVFSSAAQYFDATSQRYAFAVDRDVLLQTRGSHVEAFRMTTMQSHWVPVFSLAVANDEYALSGVWCNDDLSVVITTTDRRLQVISVDWPVGTESEASEVQQQSATMPTNLQCLETRTLVGANDCAFDRSSGTAYVLGATELLQITVARSSNAEEKANVTIVATELKQLFHFVHVSNGSLFLAGPAGCVAYPIASGSGFVDTSAEARVVTTTAVDSISGGMALVRGKGYLRLDTSTSGASTSSEDTPTYAPFSLPHDVSFLSGATELSGSSSSSKTVSGQVAYFSKGLLAVDHRSWSMTKRLHCVKCFQRKDGSVLALDRNVEGTVEGLPLCWKVRRFGN